MKVDTHKLYSTVEHYHIGNGEYELNVIQCANGLWFVENNWNDSAFSHITEISHPSITPYQEPQMFSTENEACDLAVKTLRTVLPDFKYDV